MAYTKQTFTAGQTLKASDLNTMSQGIVDKQDKLVSGTNLKTINGQSLLGSGDIAVTGDGTVVSTPKPIKKAVFLGDSIIHGVYSYFNASGGRENGFNTDDSVTKRIPAYFAEMSGAEVINLGKRGSGYVIDGRNLGNGLEVAQANDFSDVDFVGICLGINDWIRGGSLGSFTESGGGTGGDSGGDSGGTEGDGSEGSTGGIAFYNGFANVDKIVANPNSTLSGAASAAKIRLVSIPVYGAFTLEVNSGYRIRNAIQYSQKVEVTQGKDTTGINPQGTEYLATNTTSTSITVSTTNKYTVMTIAKANDTQTISPTEDIVKSFTLQSADAQVVATEAQVATVAEQAVGTPNVVQNTVIGNMVLMFQKILEDNPLCKIVCYSPYNSWGQVSVGGDYTADYYYGSEETNYALGATNSAGYTLQDLIDAIDKVCSYYGITHVPLSKNNLCNRINIKNVMIDGLHPSREAREFLAAEIYGKVYSK